MEESVCHSDFAKNLLE